MHSLPVLSELPPGYCVEESPGGMLAVHVDLALAFSTAGFGPERDAPWRTAELSGRRPLFEFDVAEQRFLVRSHRHGGLLRWFTRRRFLDPERPFRELIVSHALQRAGLRTPQVVAARARFAPGGGFYLDVVTRRVEDAIDVGRILGAVQRGELEARRLRGLYRAAGRLVRNLHKNRVLHADLTPRNVLAVQATLFEPEPELWIIDLDRTLIDEHISTRARLDNLRRLARHVERMERRGAEVLSNTDRLRFLQAYHGVKRENPGAKRAAWKETWRSIARARERRRAGHALGWWLEERFGRAATLPDEPQALFASSGSGPASEREIDAARAQGAGEKRG